MFGNERKKVILVAHEEPEEDICAELIKALIATKDDKGEDDIVGVKDGSVEASIWNYSAYEESEKTLSSSQKVICIGKSKKTSAIINITTPRFEMFGMKYGWCGNTAILYIDKKPLKVAEYEAFRKEASDIKLSLEHANEKSVFRKFFQKDLENIGVPKEHKKNVARILGLIGGGLPGLLVTDRLANTIAGNELWQQQYKFLATHFYLNALNEFLED